jgi:hypothetical protein
LPFMKMQIRLPVIADWIRSITSVILVTSDSNTVQGSRL